MPSPWSPRREVSPADLPPADRARARGARRRQRQRSAHARCAPARAGVVAPLARGPRRRRGAPARSISTRARARGVPPHAPARERHGDDPRSAAPRRGRRLGRRRRRRRCGGPAAVGRGRSPHPHPHRRHGLRRRAPTGRRRRSAPSAPGTALALDRSVQIRGAEHFNRLVQPWSCTAAPVHDPETRRILGVIDVTGGDEVVIAAGAAAGGCHGPRDRGRAARRAAARPRRAGRAPRVADARAASPRRRARRCACSAATALCSRWPARTSETVTELGPRHAELLLMLATHRQGLSAERLGELVYGDAEGAGRRRHAARRDGAAAQGAREDRTGARAAVAPVPAGDRPRDRRPPGAVAPRPRRAPRGARGLPRRRAARFGRRPASRSSATPCAPRSAKR